MSAVSLERKPLITRDLNKFELEIANLMQKIEVEKSHKSDFEIRQENDKKKAESKVFSESDLDQAAQQTAQDFLDLSTEELQHFKQASRVGGDQENNYRTTKRALDRNLLLLVSEKVGDKEMWILPQGKRKEGETLRDTAERVLKDKCGNLLKAKFLGNAPCGFYKYKYPKAKQGETMGAKIFFFKAQILDGNVELNGGPCQDFHWATRREMEKLPHEYLKAIRLFLIDEEH
ncbi:hypothetical protein AAG570_008544 [Ranatra chinensis]|uniref:Large ribosomal subunit protein mL46 n=1 Tax=Ranatra chinensis TaxID=642074 RepID=A0ABD0YR99_9HEMI